MNDFIMPTLLSMITKEEAFKDFSKRTQCIIKFVILINMIMSTIRIVKNILEVVERYRERKDSIRF